MTRVAGFLGIVLLAGTAWAALVQPAPPLPPEARPPYDEAADAAAEVAQAVRVARMENQRVLVDIGGNWCHWCVQLHKAFVLDPNIKSVLLNEYRVVYVDIGHGDKNQALLKKYGITPNAYPYLAILDGDDKLVTQQETGVFETGGGHDPVKVTAFLNKWKAQPVDAQKVMDEAMARAAKENKRVLVHFGAPWCIWCHRLEDVLYEPAVTEAIESEFVLTKIDLDRMAGGKTVQAKYRTGGEGGIPWSGVMTPEGKVTTSVLGFPDTGQDIDEWMHMLTDGRKHMSDGQAKVVREAFGKAVAKLKTQAGMR